MKKLGEVQVVHDDEQHRKKKKKRTNSTAKQVIKKLS